MLNQLYKPRPSAKAFLPNSTLVANAKPHVNKSFVFNIDLENFFHSITFARVRGLLISQPYTLSEETASVIAHLCTLNGRLPQGAPSSPIISNMICSKLDRLLQNLARDNRATYTRYADDITFSFRGPASCLPQEIVTIESTCCSNNFLGASAGKKLREIIKSNWFLINEKKTRLQGRKEKQIVTGLLVNKKVNIDRRYIRKTSALIHEINKHGVEKANLIRIVKNPDSTTPIEAHVFGRLLFISQIKGKTSPIYRKLAIRFNAISTRYKAPLLKEHQPYYNYGASFFESINNKCWALEETDEVGAQASGFMLKDNLLITCAHFFTKEGEFHKCDAYRMKDISQKFKVKLVYSDPDRDIAIAQFVEEQEPFEFFDMENVTTLDQGENVTVLGFPNLKTGTSRVNIFRSNVMNILPISRVMYAEIDKDIYDGNSGGPVLNNNHNIIGIAARGADSKTGHNAFILKGEIDSVVKKYLDEVKQDHQELSLTTS